RPPWGSGAGARPRPRRPTACAAACTARLEPPTGCARPAVPAMLHLASTTDTAWLARALAHLDEILVDHAHCEKKAASTALSLLFRYPEQPELLTPLARLAREELTHFEEVLDRLRARGLGLRRQQPSPYASELMAGVRAAEPGRLVDTLLCMALIEARSC